VSGWGGAALATGPVFQVGGRCLGYRTCVSGWEGAALATGPAPSDLIRGRLRVAILNWVFRTNPDFLLFSVNYKEGVLKIEVLEWPYLYNFFCFSKIQYVEPFSKPAGFEKALGKRPYTPFFRLNLRLLFQNRHFGKASIFNGVGSWVCSVWYC
jgi:hypothetical protein